MIIYFTCFTYVLKIIVEMKTVIFRFFLQSVVKMLDIGTKVEYI